MQVEIDDRVVSRLRELVQAKLTEEDITFLADCLTWIGIAMVNSSLEKYPGLTFGELLTMFFKNQHH